MERLKKVLTTWDERICTDAAPTNSTSKAAEIIRRALKEGLIETRKSDVVDLEATWASILKTHARTYVDAVRSGNPKRLAESQGFTWSPGFAESVTRVWHAQIEACRLARCEGVAFHPASGAHHADRDRGGGFCTFNFLVGAANAMLGEGCQTVAIIDLDAHQGDGTVRLIRGRRGIAMFDIAGAQWEPVTDDGCVEFYEVGGAAAYREALANLPRFLDRIHPDLVQYQAGVDAYHRDPVGHIPGVSAGFLAERDRNVIWEVRRRGIPLVINVAGGYLEGVSERLHVNTVRRAAQCLGFDAASTNKEVMA